MIRQNTIKNSIKCKGIGLHSGNSVNLTLHPAPGNEGIVFYRTDVTPHERIAAHGSNVVSTDLSTTIGNGSNRPTISTVEHLMSAFKGLGIDNVYVEVNGPEVPIMDGSAAPFVFLIQSAGILEQLKFKKLIRIKKTITIKDGDKFIRIEPYDGFKIDYSIDFDHPVFKDKPAFISLDFKDTSYIQDISRARTFGFVDQIEALLKKGLIKGGSTKNAILIDDYHIVNEEGLRYTDEFVRHKALDCLGDIGMFGASMLGKITAHKSGHDLNNRLVRALNSDYSAWEIVHNGYKEIRAPQRPVASFG
jgi:UDP-3-O-[3-hydroxymyristoyl] N-acetylglucosamine deacetylase